MSVLFPRPRRARPAAAVMPNICIPGPNHLVELNCIFKFISLTHDLMAENNNSIVTLIEKSERSAGLIAEGLGEGGSCSHTCSETITQTL